MNIEEVREYVKLLKEEDLKVLTLKDGDMKIHIEANAGEPAAPATGVSKSTVPADGGTASHEVKAKQVGTFYSEKEEDSDETFVEVGDEVKAGDKLAVIEAMKVFNDVTSDVSGTVEEILVGNGESVEYDQPLFIIQPKEG